MSVHSPPALPILVIFALILMSPRVGALGFSPQQTEHQYPTGSWGLGVVVPEASGFVGGGRLSWVNATIVSLTITLPNMSFTDYPILAVESVMAADGSVMQIAAGLYPTHTDWLAYAWYIGNVQASPQSYDWVLNGSQPMMAAGSRVSLSIYLSQGMWHYRIQDLATNDEAEGEYAYGVPPRLRAADQEVFALESYSTSNFVFAHMGNLTLDTLTVNGRQVATGWYAYGAWDTHHNPPFVVGGLGPPPFISLQEAGDATLVWSYQEWSGPVGGQPAVPLTITVGVPAVILVAIALAILISRRRLPSKCPR